MLELVDRFRPRTERAFVERTSAAIIVLLLFLIAANGLIVILRRKLERRW